MYEWLADPRVAWFLFGLVLLLGELILPGIVLIFFGFGAWTVVLGLTMVTFGFSAQLAVFIITSFIYLFLFRSKLTALFYNKTLQFGNFSTSLQEGVIGREVDVVESIMPPHPGWVLLNGTLWQAKADKTITAGSRVRVIDQEILLLMVEAV